MKKKVIKAKAIIFDMDGVITDTMPYHFKAWQEAFLKAGIKADCCDIYLREGQKGKDTVREIFEEKRGEKPSLKLVEQILEYKESLFKKRAKPKLIKDMVKFISFLNKKNFRLALVTGTSRREVKKVLPNSLFRKFEVIVTSDEVRRGKPNPQPYKKAVKLLGIKPKEAVVIENAPFGIKSAKKAGLACIALATSLPKQHLKEADVVLSSASKLKSLLC